MLRNINVIIAMAVALLISATSTAASLCPERPACHGCGCKGGPGYRGPDGHCVGYQVLAQVCGNPPTQHCVFENAPGTGANKACALGANPHPAPYSRPSLPTAKRDG